MSQNAEPAVPSAPQPDATQPTPDHESAQAAELMAAAEVAVPGRLMRLHERLHRNRVTGLITKIVVTLVGVLVFLAGVVMMITPGPGVVGMILGLAILATEWTWADRLVTFARRKASEAAQKARDMDPAVRRRHLLTVTAVVVVVAALVVGYLVWQGWPQWAISGWDKVQDISGAVPDLPGM